MSANDAKHVASIGRIGRFVNAMRGGATAAIIRGVMVDLAGQLPSALRANARWERLGTADVPCLLVHPGWEPADRVPVVLWMHGRTVNKELDPGRYLRWMRAGLGACAIDLPGHGERFDASLQEPNRTLDVVMQMVNEIDAIVEALADLDVFDTDRLAIGGMSAGGMATIARLCDDHPFTCASVEATSGSWSHQQHRAMFRDLPEDDLERLDPVNRLGNWREIPFQAIHSKKDEWVGYDGQLAFIEALRERYEDPERVTLVAYEETGAPYEHAGFGRMAADAKERQTAFLRESLLQS